MLLTNAFDPDPRVHQEAKALVDAGYAVTILCWDRDYKTPPFEIIDGIKVKRAYVRSTHGRGTIQIFYLFLLFIKMFVRGILENFDIIHCHDFDTLPLGYLIAKSRRIKIIYDSHESYVDMLSTNVNKYLKKLLILCETFLISRIDCVITVGKTLSKEFASRGANHVEIVGNWKDLSDYKVSPQEISTLRKKLSISKNQIVILYIGHLHPRRMITQLLDSVSSNDKLFFLIGGYGELTEVTKRYADQFHNIHYLGYVKPKNIALYTGVCDIVYSAFDFKHPMAKYVAPNKLFDALAAGKSVLTGNFGEIGKIVKQERCGIVLNRYDQKSFQKAFARIIKDRTLLMQYSRNSKVAAKKYNWEIAEKTLLKVYKFKYERDIIFRDAK